MLVNEQSIKTIGVCLPIWSFNKGTSEPGEEVFCEYEIINNEEKPIETFKNKYKIYLPDYCRKITQIITNKQQFNSLSEEDRKLCKKVNGQMLLVKKPNLFEEDNSEIVYHEYEKVKIKDFVKVITHTVSIKQIKCLFDSFN